MIAKRFAQVLLMGLVLIGLTGFKFNRLYPNEPGIFPSGKQPFNPSEVELDCKQPKQLMLHSAFGWWRMQYLGDQILARGWRTYTYGGLYEDYYSRGLCQPDDIVLVTIDDPDLNVASPAYRKMVDEFTKRGLVLSLAIVSGEQYQVNLPEVVQDYLKMGIEFDSHTRNHVNFNAIGANEEQISGSYMDICEFYGECPPALILPFGQGYQFPEVFAMTGKSADVTGIGKGYHFVVGIKAPERVLGKAPWLMKRIPPTITDSAGHEYLAEDSVTRTVNSLIISFDE